MWTANGNWIAMAEDDSNQPRLLLLFELNQKSKNFITTIYEIYQNLISTFRLLSIEFATQEVSCKFRELIKDIELKLIIILSFSSLSSLRFSLFLWEIRWRFFSIQIFDVLSRNFDIANPKKDYLLERDCINKCRHPRRFVSCRLV